MPEWPRTAMRRTVLAFGAGVGNGLALLRVSPAEQDHERYDSKRRAPVSRAGRAVLPARARVARFPRHGNHDGHRQRAPGRSAKAGATRRRRARAEARNGSGESGLGRASQSALEFEWPSAVCAMEPKPPQRNHLITTASGTLVQTGAADGKRGPVPQQRRRMHPLGPEREAPAQGRTAGDGGDLAALGRGNRAGKTLVPEGCRLSCGKPAIPRSEAGRRRTLQAENRRARRGLMVNKVLIPQWRQMG